MKRYMTIEAYGIKSENYIGNQFRKGILKPVNELYTMLMDGKEPIGDEYEFLIGFWRWLLFMLKLGVFTNINDITLDSVDNDPFYIKLID